MSHVSRTSSPDPPNDLVDTRSSVDIFDLGSIALAVPFGRARTPTFPLVRRSFPFLLLASMLRQPATRPPRAARPSSRPAYGQPQKDFITKTRGDIKTAGRGYFYNRDWTNLLPNRGRNTCLNNDDLQMYAYSFYIKPIAAWVPHLILPNNHMPACPKCESNKSIDLGQSDWIANPIILYGVRSHKYLDTWLYKCRDCKSSFNGYNEVSLQKSGSALLGIFNFRLSRGFAVDDELYSCIINNSKQTTASTYRTIARQCSDKYYTDLIFYCQAVLAKKVVGDRPNTVAGSRGQRTLDAHLTEQQFDPLKIQKEQLVKVDRELRQKACKFETDVPFGNIFKQKSDRNNWGLPFAGIGAAKCQKLILRGILTAKELLEYEGNDPEILPQWKGIVERYYAELKKEVDSLSEKKSELEALLGIVYQRPSTGPYSEQPRNQQPAEPPAPPPPFGKFTDPLKCNGRVVPKATIDRLVATDFLERKPLQDAKMRSLSFSILKIDAHYKVPPKIKVYTGRGVCFSPYKCGVTIQNEDSMRTQ